MWPLVVAGCLCIGRGRRTLVVVVAASAALASAVLMAALADDTTRAYFGTDTRVHSLLIGALLAVLLSRAAHAQISRVSRTPVSSPSARSWSPTRPSATANRSCTAAGSCCSPLQVAVVIAAAVHPGGPVRRVLSLGVLVWIGRISYGLYLWHWPVQLIVDSERTGISGVPLDLARGRTDGGPRGRVVLRSRASRSAPGPLSTGASLSPRPSLASRQSPSPSSLPPRAPPRPRRRSPRPHRTSRSPSSRRPSLRHRPRRRCASARLRRCWRPPSQRTSRTHRG